MTRIWAVFLRRNIQSGDPADDLNVLSQHEETYTGVVLGDDYEIAVKHAEEKTGKSPVELLVLKNDAFYVGEGDSLKCPHCKANPLAPDSGSSRPVFAMADIRISSTQFQCPHCRQCFSGMVETKTRTVLLKSGTAKL